MKRIVLITCVKDKKTTPSKASEMYLGDFFQDNLAYAKKLNPYLTFILSGKYGLLELEDVIEPYDVNLEIQTEKYRAEWASKVIASLKEKTDIHSDKFTIVATKGYYELLTPFLKNTEIPFDF